MRIKTSSLVTAALAVLGAYLQAFGQESVSVYCSLDAEHSQWLLEEFEKRSGIHVKFTMDTEETKTVGLVNRIISERENPRCDVFWNNELAQTIRLRNMGLLQPYVSPSAADIPAKWKDPNAYWAGFAARARVIIYNKNLLGADRPTGLADLTSQKWAGKCAMAKPLVGTVITHAAALFAYWGEDKAKAWFRELAKAGVYWENGNAPVMRTVGEGGKLWGYTDTDDAYVSELRNAPTGVIVPDQGPDDIGTLIIPNSVAIVKGARNLANARKIVDYILSREVEQKLAEGRSAQIPVRAGVPRPAHVLDLSKVKAMPADWEKIGVMIEKHGPFLQELFDGGDVEPGVKSRAALWIGIGVVGAVLAIALAMRRKARDAGGATR